MKKKSLSRFMFWRDSKHTVHGPVPEMKTRPADVIDVSDAPWIDKESKFTVVAKGGAKFISWVCTKCLKDVETVDERTGRCPDCQDKAKQ